VVFLDGSKVTSAEEVSSTEAAPRHCQVTVWVPDRINIFVVLPMDNWNGRFQAIGNGGYAGSIAAVVPLSSATPQAALAQGYVAAATDTGHQGSPLTGEWAWSPTGMNYSLIRDFAYRANHEMAVKAKTLIGEFYGRPPSYSYWNGCSTGGREGLTAAMRYPDDFDGIVAAAPAINWTKFIPAEMWPQLVMKESGNFLPQCKLQAITNRVTEICDPGDGLKDGLFDPLRCDIKAAQLKGLQTDCGEVSDADVAVIQKIWEGPRRADGQFMWYGLEPGADLGSVPGLTLAATVSAPDGTAIDGVSFPVSNDWFKWWLHKDPLWDWHSLTYDQFFADFDQSVVEWADYLSTNNPDLSGFRSRGGKIVMWHGLADPVIFPRGTVNYYESVMSKMGQRATNDFARLFLAPSVGHCSGGTGPVPADPLAAVVKWREQGQAPASLIATLPAGTGVNTSNEEMTRPLCPYPQVPIYLGSGSTFKAENFKCGTAKK
jgi:pimeloyl-ACP methyl ester carboxylesterase